MPNPKLSPAARGEDFSVPTYGIACTHPLDMPPDAFAAWASAIELTSPAVAAEWREKRARAARGEMVSVPPTDIAGADPMDAPSEVFEAWVASFESDSPAVAAAWREKRAQTVEAKALREGDIAADADDAGDADAPPDAALPAQPAVPAEPPIPPVEPYDFDRCTITIGIQLLPLTDGGDPRERQAIIGVRNHNDPPIIRFAALEEITSPVVIANLLAQLRAELPVREQAHREREAQARADEQARQVGAAQLRADAAAKKKAAKKKPKPTPTDAPPPAASSGETSAPDASPQAIVLPASHIAPNPRAESPAPPTVAAQQALF